MFRVGEKVECVKASEFTHLELGKEYEIWKCDEELKIVQVLNEVKDLIWVGFDYFEKKPSLYDIGIVKQYVDEKGGE